MIRVVEAAYACAFEPDHLQRFLGLFNSYLGVKGSYLLATGEGSAQVRAARARGGGRSICGARRPSRGHDVQPPPPPVERLVCPLRAGEIAVRRLDPRP